MPIQPKVAAGDGKIGRHGKLLAGAYSKQSAVVADAETQPAVGGAMGELRCPRANLLQECQFTQGQLDQLAGTGLLATGLHVLQDRVLGLQRAP